jgi:hypothetical protein
VDDNLPKRNWDADMGEAGCGVPVPHPAEPAFVQPKPLSECAVAIVTASGPYEGGAVPLRVSYAFSPDRSSHSRCRAWTRS